MREKKADSMVRTKPGSYVLVRLDGREEPYPPAASELADGREEPDPPAASDLAKINATSDEDVARQTGEHPDVVQKWTDKIQGKVELGAGHKLVARRGPGRPKSAAPKKPVSLRLDPDVIEGFRAGGAGWQSRMSAVLRAHLMGAGQTGEGQTVRKKPAKRLSVSHVAPGAKPVTRR